MKPLSLNLKDVKKIGGDKNSSTFLHPSGHKIVIAHSPLSALQRKQIEKMPVHKYAEGTPKDPVSDSVNDSPDQIVADAGGDTSDATPSSPSADAEQAASGANGSWDPSPAQPNPQPYSDPVSRSMSEQELALNNEKSAYNNAAAGADQGLNKAYSSVFDPKSGSMAQLPTQQDLLNKYQEKNSALYNQYASQKINPNQVLDNMGPGSKLLAGIGLILGGLGGRGNGNQGLDVLNKAIDRNVAAQQSNAQNTLNLYKMNESAYGNQVAALNATKEQMLTALKYKIDIAGASANSLQAKTNAQVASAKIDQEIGQLHYQRALMTPSQDNLDPSLVVNALIPSGPDRDKALEEIKNNQNMVQLAPAIDDSFEKAAIEARPLTGGITDTSPQAFNPINETPNQKRFEGLMNTTVKEKEGTARAAAFKSIKDTQRPSLGDSDYDIATKRALKDSYMRANMAAPVAMSHGIDLSKFPSTSLNRGAQAPATNNALSLKLDAFMKKNPQVSSQQEAIKILKDAGKL